MTTRAMKKALLLTAAATATLLAACQNTTHRVDRFDNVRIQQMEANNVSRDWFEKVVVCLNARREIRADGTADHFLLLEHTRIPEFNLAPADVRRRIRSPLGSFSASLRRLTLRPSRPAFETVGYPYSGL